MEGMTGPDRATAAADRFLRTGLIRWRKTYLGFCNPRQYILELGRAGLGPGPDAKAGSGEKVTSRHFLLGQENCNVTG